RYRVRLLVREEEKELVPLFVGKDFRDLDRPAAVETPDVMTVKRPWQALSIVEEVVGVERFVADEIVGAAVVVSLSAFRHNRYLGSAVDAKLRRIVVSEDLYLGNSVLVGSHADFVVAARLTSVQAVDCGNRGAASLPGNDRQIGAEPFAYSFDIID